MLPGSQSHIEAEKILDFWFGTPGAPDCGRPRDAWFGQDPDFDDSIRERFGALHARAARGELDGWADDARSCLALIVLLDQFSRNLYRDDPRAFANDGHARALARRAVERGFDQAVHPEMRTFFYLPFEHSEALADQRLSVRLIEANDGVADPDKARDYAYRHFAVIERFGRFPHRNTALGRVSRPEELEFLEHTKAGF